jgi:putative DNA primase/helicase
MRYVPAWGRWIVWDGKRWALDKTGQVQRFAKDTVHRMHVEAVDARLDRSDARALSKWAFSSESQAHLAAMVALARTELDIPVLPEQLDSDPYLFNVENGTFDLRTGELLEHDLANLITKLAAVEGDTDATAEKLEAFLLEIMDGRAELVGFIQRMVGYSMTGKVTEHVLLFLYGHGANGKSTLMNVLLRLFGDYGQQCEPELLIKKRGDAHPTGVADLKGARLVSMSEIDAGRRMAESLVKQLTGGDRIKARYMREDFFEFEPTHKLWLMANHKPVVRGTDLAIWRRIKLVPFDVTIPDADQDPHLSEKLEAELPGILNWAVQGCLDWQRDGLAPPDAVKVATKGYRTDMDTLAVFIEEHCTIAANAYAEAKDLYDQYKSWADESGERKQTNKVFGLELKERGFETRKDPRTRRLVYLGIGLDKGSEAKRSSSNVTPIENTHVGTNVNAASDRFGKDTVDSLLGGPT